MKQGLISISRGTVMGLAVAATTVAAPVAAQPPGQAPAAVIVSYSGTDLDTAKGRAKLQNRIAWAATSICLEDDRASPAPQQVDQSCYRSVMSNSLAQVNRRIAQRTGRAVMLAVVAR